MYRTSLSITIYLSTGKSGLFVQYYRVQSIPEIQLAENDSIVQINKPFLEREIYIPNQWSPPLILTPLVHFSAHKTRYTNIPFISIRHTLFFKPILSSILQLYSRNRRTASTYGSPILVLVHVSRVSNII